LERDLGIALARFARTVPPDEIVARGDPRVAAVGRLKQSLVRWPGDAEAWEALSTTRSERGQVAEKLKAAKNAFQLAPHDESAVTTLTEAATVAGEFELALQMAEKWVALSPRSAEPLIARGFIRLKKGDWLGAEADCRSALKIHPFHAEAHLYIAICRHNLGDPRTGAKIAQTAAELETDPREKAALTDWYRRATR
jgi:tetratricopeptide (TPR) repeat protein